MGEFSLTTGSLTIIACGAFTIALGMIAFSVRFNHRFPQNAKFRRTVRLLGLTTYPLYLLHESLGGFVLDRMNQFELNHLGGVLISIACVVGISALIASYCEPALKLVLRNIGRGQRSMPAICA